MAVLHPVGLLVCGFFQASKIFSILIFKKFQPTKLSHIVQVHQFYQIFHPSQLIHLARLLNNLFVLHGEGQNFSHQNFAS